MLRSLLPGSLGHAGELVRMAMTCDSDDVVGIAFAPESAYTQTPGPRAGEPLR
jgi:hypothetical protein